MTILLQNPIYLWHEVNLDVIQRDCDPNCPDEDVPEDDGVWRSDGEGYDDWDEGDEDE